MRMARHNQIKKQRWRWQCQLYIICMLNREMEMANRIVKDCNGRDNMTDVNLFIYFRFESDMLMSSELCKYC